jgi:hypothetical protein
MKDTTEKSNQNTLQKSICKWCGEPIIEYYNPILKKFEWWHVKTGSRQCKHLAKKAVPKEK